LTLSLVSLAKESQIQKTFWANYGNKVTHHVNIFELGID
jgi:hypothetical protein